eukprot:UN13049
MLVPFHDPHPSLYHGEARMRNHPLSDYKSLGTPELYLAFLSSPFSLRWFQFAQIDVNEAIFLPTTPAT